MIWYSPWFCRFACLLFFASENLRLLLLFFSRVCVYEFCCVVYCFCLLCLFPIQHIRLHRRQQCATLVYVNMIFRFFFSSVLFKIIFFSCMFLLYIFSCLLIRLDYNWLAEFSLRVWIYLCVYFLETWIYQSVCLIAVYFQKVFFADCCRWIVFFYVYFNIIFVFLNKKKTTIFIQICWVFFCLVWFTIASPFLFESQNTHVHNNNNNIWKQLWMIYTQ